MIDRFADTVVRQRGPGFRFTKALGDGFMLVYGDAHAAVAAGGRVVDAMRGIDTPGVHASVHSGVALVREGDYFGSAVNLAARLLLAAERDQLVATRPVVEETGSTFTWEPAGTQRMRRGWPNRSTSSACAAASSVPAEPQPPAPSDSR